ncbi:MAG: hypothetical protein AAGH87_06375 [Pseudomonadota bacterium]
MLKPNGLLFLICAAGVLSAPSAAQDSAGRCAAMAQTFEAKRAEILALQAAQARLAETAETLGETWEQAEEQRLFSAGQADAADAAQAAFETARQAANRAAMDLRSKAQMFQADAAQFNASCAPG